MIECLAVIKNEGLISIWHDNEILPGDKWREEIFSTHLPDSDILLYLVSAASLASENCNKELGIALKKNIKPIPIILEDCDWKRHQLNDFQALPDECLPINEWQPESKGWQNVVTGIRKDVEEMQVDVQNGTLPRWVFQQGNFLLMLGHIDRAIEAYSHAIELNPNNASTYNNRGAAYERKGDIDRAIQDYTKAIELNLNNAIAYTNRGGAYRDKGDIDRAIEDCNIAIDLETRLY